MKRTMTDSKFATLVQQAYKRNNDMDEIDHEVGFATPEEVGIQEVIRVAAMALKAGIKTQDQECILDAYVLLIKAQGKEKL